MKDHSKAAFPVAPNSTRGMTLREYYAGVALAGLLAADGVTGHPVDFAKWSVGYADALIEKLEEK